MSYNTQHCLNFVTRKIDYDIIVDTIKKCNADIIGFQEYDLNWQTHLSPALTHKYGVIFKSRSRNDTECTPIFYKKDITNQNHQNKG